MKEFQVHLNSINDVRAFVTAASMVSCDIDVLSGRYLVDAKSIMGLFSLDLSQPVTIQIHSDHSGQDSFVKAIQDLIVEA